MQSHGNRYFGPCLFLFAYTLLIILFIDSHNQDNSLVKKNRRSDITLSQTKNFEDNILMKSEEETNYEEKTVAQKIAEITGCMDTIQRPSIKQHGDYWILNNYVTSKIQFKCSETITYVTHGDYTFLDNLIPLLNRWKGPISMAIYAPGDDFQKTIDSIWYLRKCGPEIVADFVTFHIYFHNNHMPKNMSESEDFENFDCGKSAPFLLKNGSKTYKEQNNLTFPVNLGRNIARNGAQTHFILVSDIELYPSLDVIPKFLDMIARNGSFFGNDGRRIFPLPVFEVDKDQKAPPETKTKLQELLRAKKAVFFHQKVCPLCHRIPSLNEWINITESPEINVFVSGKRSGSFKNWEPIFIGTNQDPFYEERQSWEGMSDKMTQGYALCVLDYDLMVLDNAFLCHKPGIKLKPPPKERYKFMSHSYYMIKNKILPELKILFGEREGCVV